MSAVTGVAGLVLAAGAGRRFGGPKAVAELAGATLLDRAVETLRAGGTDPVVAVVPPGLTVRTRGARLVENPDAASGMGSSLRVGLAAVGTGDASAVVVLLVDTPLVGPEAVRRLVSAYRSGAVVAVATYGGRRGHPVLLGRACWDDAARAAAGDRGARAFLAAHPDLVTEVACDGTGNPLDVDTPEDLARARDCLTPGWPHDRGSGPIPKTGWRAATPAN